MSKLITVDIETGEIVGNEMMSCALPDFLRHQANNPVSYQPTYQSTYQAGYQPIADKFDKLLKQAEECLQLVRML